MLLFDERRQGTASSPAIVDSVLIIAGILTDKYSKIGNITSHSQNHFKWTPL